MTTRLAAHAHSVFDGIQPNNQLHPDFKLTCTHLTLAIPVRHIRLPGHNGAINDRRHRAIFFSVD